MDFLNDKIAKALGIKPEDVERLRRAEEHEFYCKCSACLDWWRLCGPAADGSYGPFTQEEIDKERTKE